MQVIINGHRTGSRVFRNQRLMRQGEKPCLSESPRLTYVARPLRMRDANSCQDVADQIILLIKSESITGANVVIDSGFSV